MLIAIISQNSIIPLERHKRTFSGRHCPYNIPVFMVFVCEFHRVSVKFGVKDFGLNTVQIKLLLFERMHNYIAVAALEHYSNFCLFL